MRLTQGFTPGVTRGRVGTPRPPPDLHLPPVHFYAEAQVNPGAEATLRGEALSNRTGRSIEIHEIRLSGSTSANPVVIQTYTDLGTARVRLVGGGKPITNSFVPMWNLGRTENRVSQCYPYGSGSANAYYVWRLSKPWYLPPDYPIECQFLSPGNINLPMTARISLVGRYVSGRKTTTSLPFAAAYVSKGFDYAAVDSDESSEKDLANFVGKTVHIDRIIGRAGIVSNTGGAYNSSMGDDDDPATNESMTIRMVTSDNFPIIQWAAGIRQIFGYYPSSIDVAHDLDPGKFYRVSVRKTAGPVMIVPYTTYSAWASVSILGWREEGV